MRFDPGKMPPRVRDFFAQRIHSLWEWTTATGAVGPDDPHGRRFGHMGHQAMIAFPPGGVFGHRWIHIGDHTLIGPHVAMSVGFWNEDLDPALAPVLRFGDRVNVGRFCSFVTRVGVTVGDDTTIAPGVYVTDHNHAYDDPDAPIAHQWPRSAPVEIGPGCWIGANAILLPGTTLGRNVVVAGGSVVRGTFDDHSVVAGVPARVVRRRVDGEWDPPIDTDAETPPDDWPHHPT